MKIIKNVLPILICVFSAVSLFAQSKQAAKNLQLLKKNEQIKTLSGNATAADFLQNEYQNLGLAKAEDLQLHKTVETKGNWKHHRYQQFHEGLPVLTGVYILHEKDNVLRKANGNILPHIHVNTTPTINVENAILTAKEKAIRAESDANFGKKPAGLTLDAIENSAPKLVVADRRYPENSGKYTLAYLFELEFHSFPPRHEEYLVDAHSGEVISSISQVCHINVEGTVKTKYYGDRTVMIDSVAPDEYYLRDLTRGDGIVTESDISDEVFSDTDKYFDTYNGDEFDDTAGDVHWGATEYYDWLMNAFTWDGLDNEGHELKSVVHTGNGRSYVNAFWNGRYASFGDGDCTEYGPLTTIDVVSHEFTHGLTEFSSGLIYRNESGALNESMSDMFGKALEWYLDRDNFTWEIGGGFVTGTDAESFRDMSDPNMRNHPKLYKGEFWSGFGAVHTNSNVMNYWFHLLVEGGAGTNEVDVDFDVKSIGMDKVMDIVFAVNTGYLTPNSTYLHAYHSSVEVATDLFGTDSDELANVKEAWKAVGIVVAEPYTLDKDLTIRLLNQDSLICGNDAELQIMVEVENFSKAAISAGTEIPLGFRLNSSGGFRLSSETIETMTLTEDFEPGDTLPYTFTALMQFDDAAGFRDNLEAFIGEDFGDEYAFNDSDLHEVEVSESAGRDLSLRVSNLSGSACEPSQLRLSIYTRNEGCEIIPEGTPVQVVLDLLSDNVVYDYSLPFDLEPNSGYTEYYYYDIVDFPTGEFDFFGDLNLDNDSNADNNEYDNTGRLFQQTGSDYFENFTDFEREEDPYLDIDEGYRHITELVTFNGEQMLGFTGEDAAPSNIDSGCQDLEKILEENFGFDGRIEFCADVAGLSAPTLSFDMVQFTVESPFNFPEEFTSVLSVGFARSGDDPMRIYGQPEGEVVTYNIPMPIDFEGKIGLEAFTMIGGDNVLSQGNFENSNVILLDNIRVTNGPVSTSQLIDNQKVSVFPNPATDAVWFENISGNLGGFDIEIFNTLGAKIQVFEAVSGKTEWQTDTQMPGVYFYKINQNGALIDAGKVVLEK